jgi:MFS family permease
MPERNVASTYLQWVFMRAIFHRGWWLVTSLYLVVEAQLTAFQLVFIGVAQAITALVFEIPTGVVADTFSRKWSVVFSHLLMGIAMLWTGLVTSFPVLVATQMLWGLSWTFSSGADVAWLTDELDRPERVAATLAAGARRELLGAASGLIVFGGLAWATDLSTAIVVAGIAMLMLGIFVVLRFTEFHFTPVPRHRYRESLSILRRGLQLARGDHEIMIVFAATFLVNGAAEAYERLYAKRLLELGFPAQPDPIVWLTMLGLVALLVGALAIRIVEARIDGIGVARPVYAGACFAGAIGLTMLALAPDTLTAMAGVLLVSGIGWTVTRCVSVIWINRRATSDVRATVQSLLAQAEYGGEIVLGVALGVLAWSTSIAVALVGSCMLLATAGVMALRARDRPGN